MKTKNIFLKISIFSLFNLILITNDYAQKKQDLFFGQHTPGDSAVSFDLGITFPDNRKPSNVCFAPNNTDCYFTVWGEKFSWVKVFLVKYENGKYTPPVEVSFSKGYRTASPFITKDGNRIYFNSKRDTIRTNSMDLFFTDKINNSWSEATLLHDPFNTINRDYSYSESIDGKIVFASNRPGGQGHDLYIAKKNTDDTYSIENLSVLNSPLSDFGPFISPDGSYIIFTSERSGKIGHSDLYISFLAQNDEWTIPVNMEISGENYGINFKNKFQDSPYITSDGKYLFFNRNGIHWISTKKLINQLKELTFRNK